MWLTSHGLFCNRWKLCKCYVVVGYMDGDSVNDAQHHKLCMVLVWLYCRTD